MKVEHTRAAGCKLPWICATLLLKENLQLLHDVAAMPGGSDRIESEWHRYKRIGEHSSGSSEQGQHQ